MFDVSLLLVHLGFDERESSHVTDCTESSFRRLALRLEPVVNLLDVRGLDLPADP